MFHYGFLNASFFEMPAKCVFFFVYAFLIILFFSFFFSVHVRVSQYQHLISLLADGGGVGVPIFLFSVYTCSESHINSG